MDENKNGSQNSNTSDIDEVIKVFHKEHANDIPQAPTNADATRVSFEPVKKPTAPKPMDTDAKPAQATEPTVKKAASASVHSSTVSLDDFNTGELDKTQKADHKHKKGKDDRVSFLGSVPFGVVKLVAYIAFVLVSAYLLSTTVINVGNDVFAFVKDGEAVINPEKNVNIILPEGASTGDVAKILEEAGVIEYPWVFEQYAKFRISRRSYLDGTYLFGEQTVNPMMNYDTLIATLADYERTKKGTVRITFSEGLTVDETIDLLVQNGVGKKEDYTEALQEFAYEYKFAGLLTKESLSKYRFDTDYSYRLEGYLFPDTYDFYLNENPISALNKFLVNFNKKFEEEFYERAEELGMTVDEVITLASLIEKEGNNAEDYYYISSVFHNRLKNSASFPYLNSDASLQYALDERTGLYNLDTTLDHPYNTYKYRGLPPGPICNPGTEAIYAALYPYDTNYYYFYTKKNGETVYSRTFEQHQNYVNADKKAS